jgi:hypothetical protein
MKKQINLIKPKEGEEPCKDWVLFFDTYPFALRLGYTGGWVLETFDNSANMIGRLEELRETAIRPPKIIIEGLPRVECSAIQNRWFWLTEIFCLKDGFLYDGYGPSRRYFCKKWPTIDGGECSW